MKKLIFLCLSTLSLMGYSQTSVNINDSVTYQTITGLGSFCDCGINTTAFITQLVSDMGLTLIRWDYNFTSGLYTDPTSFLASFKSIAISNNEPFKVFFSVWTPPADWKANNSVCDDTCSSSCNADANLNGGNCDGTLNVLLYSHYQDFATTSASFIQSVYTNTGVQPYAFSIQNEPAFNEPYISCKYTAGQYDSLLKTTHKAFAVQGLPTLFLGTEDMGSAPN